MHTACHQVWLERKSLNTKRLSPYSRSKSLTESFHGWDWLFRFWDARRNRATQSEYVAVVGAGSVTDERSWIAYAHGYGKSFIVRADENPDGVFGTGTRLTRLRGEFDFVIAIPESCVRIRS